MTAYMYHRIKQSGVGEVWKLIRYFWSFIWSFICICFCYNVDKMLNDILLSTTTSTLIGGCLVTHFTTTCHAVHKIRSMMCH